MRESIERKSEQPANLEDEPCSICLDINTKMELSCFHRFHRRCLDEQLKHKRECPVCRSTQVAMARSCCEECGRGAFRVNLSKADILKKPVLCGSCKS